MPTPNDKFDEAFDNIAERMEERLREWRREGMERWPIPEGLKCSHDLEVHRSVDSPYYLHPDNHPCPNQAGINRAVEQHESRHTVDVYDEVVLHLNRREAEHLLNGRKPYPACIERDDCNSCRSLHKLRKAMGL